MYNHVGSVRIRTYTDTYTYIRSRASDTYTSICASQRVIETHDVLVTFPNKKNIENVYYYDEICYRLGYSLCYCIVIFISLFSVATNFSCVRLSHLRIEYYCCCFCFSVETSLQYVVVAFQCGRITFTHAEHVWLLFFLFHLSLLVKKIEHLWLQMQNIETLNVWSVLLLPLVLYSCCCCIFPRIDGHFWEKFMLLFVDNVTETEMYCTALYAQMLFSLHWCSRSLVHPKIQFNKI